MTTSTSTKSKVNGQVSRLQAIADLDPRAAQDAAWAWIERLEAGLPGQAAEAQLAQLFAAGAPAVVDGQTQGMFVGWTMPDAHLDRSGRAVRAIAKFVTERLGLIPWLGKKFDRASERGTNSVTATAVVFTKLLAPRSYLAPTLSTVALSSL